MTPLRENTPKHLRATVLTGAERPHCRAPSGVLSTEAKGAGWGGGHSVTTHHLLRLHLLILSMSYQSPQHTATVCRKQTPAIHSDLHFTPHTLKTCVLLVQSFILSSAPPGTHSYNKHLLTALQEESWYQRKTVKSNPVFCSG